MRNRGPCPPLLDRGTPLVKRRGGSEAGLARSRGLGAGASLLRPLRPLFLAVLGRPRGPAQAGRLDGGTHGAPRTDRPAGPSGSSSQARGGPGPDRKDRPRGRPRGPPAVFRACVAGWLVTGGDTAASFRFGRRDPGIPIPAPRWPALRVSDQSRNFPCLRVLLDDVRMTVTVPMPAVITAPTSQAPARVW